MKIHILEKIEWWDLVSQRGESIDKTFELLCADFMKIKFKLDSVPLPSQNDNYPWIEWEPVIKDWLYYQFQAKFWDVSFNTSNSGFKHSLSVVNSKLSDETYKLNILWLFSIKDYPTTNRSIWDKYFLDYEKDNNLKIGKFFWSGFLSELWKEDYIKLLHSYFPIEKIKEDIYSQCEDKSSVCPIKLNGEIENVKKWFEWDYLDDIKKAERYQKIYTYKKLAYSTKPWILDHFEELEGAIADEIFEDLELCNFTSLDEYIAKWEYFLLDTNSIKKYKTELSSLIHGKRGLFVNYWTQWQSFLKYIESNKIEFKDKRNENSI